MFNILHDAGLLEKEKIWQNQMKQLDIKKQLGTTWITVNRAPHIFYANDNQHPQIQSIIAHISSVLATMAKLGYSYKNCHVVEENEMFEKHRFHSKKLALVFGLMSTLAGTPLVLENNL